MKDIILRVSGLCKSYSNDGEQNHVLRNIDMEIYKGDFTIIMGSSGSGKSTLLYNLSGMDKPTSGEVEILGKRIDSISEAQMARLRREYVGFVFQQVHLVSNLTMFENITVPGYLLKKESPRKVEKKAKELLKSFGLEGLERRLPSQLSGGQQQRGAIARALINSPAMLFADEPTGALNSRTGREILNILSDLNKTGQSILMVTHDVKAAIRANRIIYIHDGQINGELTLDPYMPDNELDRERQILSWLSSKGW
jgi:putative ABC transport system ATP-binding protein